MIYEWDSVKSAANVKKHRVRFEEAASVFLDPLALTFPDPYHSKKEDREITIGHSARGRVLFVAHIARGDRIRIISARRATRREQKQYEEGTGEATA
ncbi:MAG: BrnT family toxin [Planctomycetota bacterium]